jgi:hypothetical protein
LQQGKNKKTRLMKHKTPGSTTLASNSLSLGSVSQEPIARLRLCMAMGAEIKAYFEEGSKLLQQLDNTEGKKEEVAAYRAAFTAMQAQYETWPIEKFKLVNKALPQLIKLAQENPQNVEIIFVKTAVFARLPVFFQRRKEALQDIEKLITLTENEWNTLDKELRTVIVDFLTTSPILTSTQQKKINQWVEAEAKQ